MFVFVVLYPQNFLCDVQPLSFLGVFFLETLPVEAKPVWHKQAIELEEEIIVTEEPA